jgi:hypothetical protein
MDKPEHFELEGDIAVLRLTGSLSLQKMVKSVTVAIEYARKQEVRKLLVGTICATGFQPPSLASRYFFVHDWARAAGGTIRLAVAARKEMIDPQKFGVTVGANAGLVGDVFESEAEARAWLQSLE